VRWGSASDRLGPKVERASAAGCRRVARHKGCGLARCRVELTARRRRATHGGQKNSAALLQGVVRTDCNSLWAGGTLVEVGFGDKGSKQTPRQISARIETPKRRRGGLDCQFARLHCGWWCRQFRGWGWLYGGFYRGKEGRAGTPRISDWSDGQRRAGVAQQRLLVTGPAQAPTDTPRHRGGGGFRRFLCANTLAPYQQARFLFRGSTWLHRPSGGCWRLSRGDG